MAAIFEPLFTKLKPTFYQSQHLSQWLSQSWDWNLLWNPLRLSPWAQVKYSNNLRQKSQVWVWDRAKTFHEVRPCKSCFLQLCDFRHVRRYLPHDLCVPLPSLFQRAPQNLLVHTCMHTHLSLIHPRRSLWCLALFLSLDTEIGWQFWFCLALESVLNRGD